MMLFYCKLVNEGYVVESFYREGSNRSDVLNDLLAFQWPEGVWFVEDGEGE